MSSGSESEEVLSNQSPILGLRNTGQVDRSGDTLPLS